MTRYIQFPAADGGTILVEVEHEEAPTPTGGVVKAGLGEKAREIIDHAQATIEETIMETVRRNAEAFIQTMRALSDLPDEAEIAFGVNATGEAGYSAIAKAGAEANYTVTLTWKRESEDKESKKK